MASRHQSRSLPRGLERQPKRCEHCEFGGGFAQEPCGFLVRGSDPLGQGSGPRTAGAHDPPEVLDANASLVSQHQGIPRTHTQQSSETTWVIAKSETKSVANAAPQDASCNGDGWGLCFRESCFHGGFQEKGEGRGLVIAESETKCLADATPQDPSCNGDGWGLCFRESFFHEGFQKKGQERGKKQLGQASLVEFGSFGGWCQESESQDAGMSVEWL
mmetsp:Transcript_2665/g.7967  ORF Transcript_2665/g.7967 Transcript_2665/m.7967 type:complete len:217 (-) Transcript_2665:375-1025(-)